MNSFSLRASACLLAFVSVNAMSAQAKENSWQIKNGIPHIYSDTPQRGLLSFEYASNGMTNFYLRAGGRCLKDFTQLTEPMYVNEVALKTLIICNKDYEPVYTAITGKGYYFLWSLFTQRVREEVNIKLNGVDYYFQNRGFTDRYIEFMSTSKAPGKGV